MSLHRVKLGGRLRGDRGGVRWLANEVSKAGAALPELQNPPCPGMDPWRPSHRGATLTQHASNVRDQEHAAYRSHRIDKRCSGHRGNLVPNIHAHRKIENPDLRIIIANQQVLN